MSEKISNTGTSGEVTDWERGLGPDDYPAMFVETGTSTAQGPAPYDLSREELYEALANMGRYREVAALSLRDHPLPEDY